MLVSFSYNHTPSSNSDLSFIYTSELYHKARNAKSPNSFLSGLFCYAQIDLILFSFPALGHTISQALAKAYARLNAARKKNGDDHSTVVSS